MFSVHGTQVSHITGCSRPPGEVGLTPRQYTEWNVVGHAHSAGDPSQQGLLPEVYHTACTSGCAHQDVQIPKKPTTKEPQVLCLGGIYSWWHSASSANGSRSHDCAPVMWAYGIPCPAMVSPNASFHKEDKLLYPDHHRIRYAKSGFRPAHFPPLLSWSPTIVGGLQIILQPFFGLNPQSYHVKYSIIFYFESSALIGSEYIPLHKFLCTFITAT